MDINEQLKAIKTEFRLSMNGKVSQSMRESGFQYKLNFGVELPRIKAIATNFPQDFHLAQALWNEDIRECKIAASLLMPIENFTPDMAELWVEQINNIEIAELTVMNLFQKLSYAPSLSFKWIADEREFIQTCGFFTIARLLGIKGEMNDRAESEFLDQAIVSALSPNYNVRQAATVAIKKYMLCNEEHAFKVCRLVECYSEAQSEEEQALYNMVSSNIIEG
ncbi:MAG: DNA alkylation repair protein [Bacteroidales bacterium]|nr:DNA alkylation repair protein [Bacteroidales bacterium]